MNKENKKTNASSLLGLLVILFGILLLIDNVIPGLHFIKGLFSWPVLLIACGLIIGHKSQYKNPASYILIVVGVFFFMLKIFSINLSILFWPIILIALGFTLIWGGTRRKRFHSPPKEPIWDKRVYGDQKTEPPGGTNESYTEQAEENYEEESYSKGNQEYTQNYTRDEYVDSTSVFSSNKINVVSKSFKGGNVINIFAGTEINLMHADMNEPAILEVVQLFGGSKIIAPAHWVIQPEMAAIFGGIEDKRFTNTMPDSSKILYIRGTSLFGGITIKSI